MYTARAISDAECFFGDTSSRKGERDVGVWLRATHEASLIDQRMRNGQESPISQESILDFLRQRLRGAARSWAYELEGGGVGEQASLKEITERMWEDPTESSGPKMSLKEFLVALRERWASHAADNTQQVAHGKAALEAFEFPPNQEPSIRNISNFTLRFMSLAEKVNGKAPFITKEVLIYLYSSKVPVPWRGRLSDHLKQLTRDALLAKIPDPVPALSVSDLLQIMEANTSWYDDQATGQRANLKRAYPSNPGQHATGPGAKRFKDQAGMARGPYKNPRVWQCTNCNRPGHTIAYCFRPGGGAFMARTPVRRGQYQNRARGPAQRGGPLANRHR